jgi:hypothetical protein
MLFYTLINFSFVSLVFIYALRSWSFVTRGKKHLCFAKSGSLVQRQILAFTCHSFDRVDLFDDIA